MATESRKFRITVQGMYYGAHDTTGTPTVKGYTAVFTLPSMEAALSNICKHLLEPYLRKSYPDYAKFRTHRITKTEVLGASPDNHVLQMSIEDMSVAELADFCIIKHIFIDPYKHKDAEKCRAEVKVIWDNRVAQQKADQINGADKAKLEVDNLLKMNDLAATDDGTGANPNLNKIKGKQMSAPTGVNDGGAASLSVPAKPAAGGELPPADETDLLNE